MYIHTLYFIILQKNKHTNTGNPKHNCLYLIKTNKPIKKLIMRQLTNTMIMAIAVVISFCFASCNKIDGNGEVITHEMNVSQFDGISLRSVLDATIIYSDHYKVVIEAESNIMPYIITEVKNKTLILRMKPNMSFRTFKDIKATVYCKNLKEIATSGTGDIFAEEIVCSDRLDISTSGAGNVEIRNISECPKIKLGISGSGKIKIGRAVCDDCDINISGAGNCNINNFVVGKLNTNLSGAGDVSLAGECNSAKLKMSGAGKYCAYELNTNQYDINISGVGNAMVTATDDLTVKLSGAGNVYYYGNPQLNVSSSGVGKVINKN